MSGADLLAVTVLDGAGEALGGFLPRLGGALVLLVAGLLVARLAGRLVRGGLERADYVPAPTASRRRLAKR
ncbi:MAG: mechanosensitive ion channel family protein [Thermoleophilaceae bacterium]